MILFRLLFSHTSLNIVGHGESKSITTRLMTKEYLWLISRVYVRLLYTPQKLRKFSYRLEFLVQSEVNNFHASSKLLRLDSKVV